MAMSMVWGGGLDEYGSRISLADQGNLGPQTQGRQITAAHTPSGAQHTAVFLAPNCPARGQ
jgi:hypothetical protein